MPEMLMAYDSNARSLANGLMITGLFELLRAKKVITNAEIRGILTAASEKLERHQNIMTAKGAKHLVDALALHAFSETSG